MWFFFTLCLLLYLDVYNGKGSIFRLCLKVNILKLIIKILFRFLKDSLNLINLSFWAVNMRYTSTPSNFFISRAKVNDRVTAFRWIVHIFVYPVMYNKVNTLILFYSIQFLLHSLTKKKLRCWRTDRMTERIAK